MGKCEKTNKTAEVIESNQVVRSHVVEDSEPLAVTQRQKELILENWHLLVENISNVGVITFM
ncbi:hypothetical protein AVEN_25563-1, partial [Araneus ventricosus]